MKIKKILILLTLSMSLLSVSCSNIDCKTEEDKSSVSDLLGDNSIKQEDEEEDQEIRLSISAFGDLLIHNSIYFAAKTEDGYDFDEQFLHIKDKVINADYTIGNLEVPVGDSNFSNYPSFRAPWQVVKSMKDVLDVELLSTASNHTLDKGFEGLKTTLDFVDKQGIKTVGSYKTEEDAKEILIEDINGAKVAFLSYTYGTNGYPIPKDNPNSVNIINREKIKADSDKAMALGADFVVLKIHFGEEYERKQNELQEYLARFIFEETDILYILGDHPHVVQDIKEINVERNGKAKKGVVVYSMGNFISGQVDDYTDTGITVKADIVVDKKNPSNTRVETLEYTPVFMDKNPGAGLKSRRVLDINKAIDDYENGKDKLINNTEYEKMIMYRDYYREKLIQKGFVSEN